MAEMVEVRPLVDFSAADLRPLTGPYRCADTYRVYWRESEAGVTFDLRLEPLEAPFVGQYAHIDDAWVAEYLRGAEFSYGAYENGRLVGALIAERRDWNNSLWVHEFHVAAEKRGQGIGRRLMQRAAQDARAAGLRVIVCETQNQNSSAIKAYRALGFRLEGVDVSYYTNEDYPERGIAVFMKLRLA